MTGVLLIITLVFAAIGLASTITSIAFVVAVAVTSPRDSEPEPTPIGWELRVVETRGERVR